MSVIENLYNDYSSRYDELVKNTNYVGPQWLENYLTKNTKLITSILDIGCANGINGRIVKKYYPNSIICGIDISPKMIDICSQTDIYDTLFVKDVSLGLPLDLKNFDLIIANGCLEFIDNHEALFLQIKNL